MPVEDPDRPLRFAQPQAGVVLAGHARVTQAERAIARTGAPFHRLTLADRLGVPLVAYHFGVGDAPPPRVGQIVRVEGVVEGRHDRCSLKLHTCVVDPTVPPDPFLPQMPGARVATLAAFDLLVATIPEPALRNWISGCLPEAVRTRLACHPAAMRHHGARVGGLLAHSVRVTRIAVALADLVEPVDRGVLVTAALLHDVGKLEELPADPGAPPTERGLLYGHVVLGLLHVARAAADVPSLPPAQVDGVLHAIVTAHGRLEHGAPLRPATIEALLLHEADRAEATLEAACEAIEDPAALAGWTAYLPNFGGRLRVPGA